MYKCYQDNITAGEESFPLSQVIAENLFYLAMWVLTGYLLWPIWTPFGLPLLTIIWAILVVIIQVLLKKHNCSGCYYYDKGCHLGWGKISAAMFKQDSGNPKIGVKLSFFYILPPPLITLTALAFAIIKSPSWVYWFMLALFVILNAASFPVRKKGCGSCAMREVCPGSASKNKVIS
ncbi:MAG: hypothetical protein MUO31_15450 [Thermodesulfovibrionales bacterium]|nr:hypothetical protein [Thermodesulfovibrionales bacterium]